MFLYDDVQERAREKRRRTKAAARKENGPRPRQMAQVCGHVSTFLPIPDRIGGLERLLILQQQIIMTFI